MPSRQDILTAQLRQTDGSEPCSKNTLPKHRKMADSAFRFLRGSAPLFYRDLAHTQLLPPALYKHIPLCMIQGDCHVSNFGFFTEEGSHGEAVIFGLNDFDDACVGHPTWDLLRFSASLLLTQTTLASQAAQTQQASKKAAPATPPLFDPAHLPSEKTATKSIKTFLTAYHRACESSVNEKNGKGGPAAPRYDAAIETFAKDHVLRKLWKKARKRCVGGEQFLTKSALSKAITWQKNQAQFSPDNPKFSKVADDIHQQAIYHFEPFFDDTVLDLVERLDAGTGSVNMKRYYFLIGPKEGKYPEDLPLCHIVEVKKQRPAAPLVAFAHLSPTNRLNPAHLTQVCQRRMQRSPDLVLDETYWQGAHWLIRSRHHAKVGVEPADLAKAPNAKGEPGIIQYAKLCGEVLALAHMRSDRRSKAFEMAITKHLPDYFTAITSAAKDYATQTQADWQILKKCISGTKS